ncbi:MAG: MoxR family ATPase, partial [Verrucomicrobiales bacterium]
MKKIERVIEYLVTNNPEKTVYTRKEINEAAVSVEGSKLAGSMFRMLNKVSRGAYDITGVIVPLPIKEKKEMNVVVEKPLVREVRKTVVVNEFKPSYIPQIDKNFVKWGAYKDVLKIIKSGFFYPVFVTGLSGNGKTMMVEQAAANAKREFIRVQISPETDQDDLIGGFRLVAGETVFEKGPVVKAMELGAILLIDEIDRGSNKIMALQGVLEGKPITIKKTGELIEPKPGFNVIATANTKGQGSESGKFSAATIIDEAFLERFTITIEQPFAPTTTEEKILMNHMKAYGKVDEEFAKLLVSWADGIRKTFYDDGVDDVISTRRLGHIVQTYSIFNDRMKSIDLAISRFDED